METINNPVNGNQSEDVDYARLGDLYRLMDDTQKKDYIAGIVNKMKGIDGPDKDYATNLQLCHWFRTDIGLGIAVAKGLELDLDKAMAQMG